MYPPVRRGFVTGLLLTFAVATLSAAPKPAPVDFSKLVVVGDSIAAGVQNGSLEFSQQLNSFPSFIARQVRTRLVSPLVPYPGAPNKLELVSSSFPPTIQPVPGTLVAPRINPFAEVTNLAVPLQTVSDALNLVPDGSLSSGDETKLATNLVLGFPCPVLFSCPAVSQVDRAVALNPTAVLVDIGNNDILGPITSGQITALSSPATIQAFISNFAAQFGTLITKLAQTNATLIVANLPDVTTSAYFTPVTKIAALIGQPVDQIAALLGTGTTDYITLNALPTVEAILTNAQSGPIPPTCGCVVTAVQATAIRQITIQLNTVIATTVSAVPGSIQVDLFSLTDKLHADGYHAGPFKLTTDLLGGLFSLDGLHPTNTGSAIIANEIIRAINEARGTHIWPVSVQEVALFDPLVFEGRCWRFGTW